MNSFIYIVSLSSPIWYGLQTSSQNMSSYTLKNSENIFVQLLEFAWKFQPEERPSFPRKKWLKCQNKLLNKKLVEILSGSVCWLTVISSAVSHSDSLCYFSEKKGFFFDGKIHIDIPDNVVPEDIGDKFTISTWIKTGLSKGRQTIISNTDKERLDRVHFSLSTSGTKILFVHRREAIHASRDLYCNAEFQYKPAIFDSQWHHIVVIADGCAAKLYVDGEHQPPAISTPDWTLHKSNLKNRLSVGARFLAKEGVYSEKFTGYLSGLVIRPNSTLNEQV